MRLNREVKTLKLLFVSSIAVVAPGQGPKECREICINSGGPFHSSCIKTLVCPSAPVLPGWKTSILHSGEAFVNALEGTAATIDWNAPNAGLIPPKYASTFRDFESCITDAFNLDQANGCLADLKVKATGLL